MTVSGTNGATGASRVQTPTITPSVGAMSPEAIVMMLMKELGSIDGVLDEMKQRIQESTARVRRYNEQVKAIRDIIAKKDQVITEEGKINFNELTPEEIQLLAESGVLSPEDLSEAYYYYIEVARDPAKADAIKSGMEASGQELISREDLPSELTANGYDPFVGVGQYTDRDDESGRDDAVKALENGIQSVQDRINQVNAGQDMMMIQFQDFMSRRSNRINLATNLMKKLNDASDAVVGNIR